MSVPAGAAKNGSDIEGDGAAELKHDLSGEVPPNGNALEGDGVVGRAIGGGGGSCEDGHGAERQRPVVRQRFR